MNDMPSFEQQLASGLDQLAGPRRSVDAMAISRDVIAAQSPKWRFRSMFSATKFVVAGAIVALFGGFLLSGVLTQPSEDRVPPVGASASATTQAEPTEQTSEPEPTTEGDGDNTATADLLPGVDLDVEEVSPGLFRVLGDGERRTLGRITDVAVAPSGDVWVMRHNGTVYRLGEPGTAFQQRHESFDEGNDGSLWVGDRRLDGEGWLADESAFCRPGRSAEGVLTKRLAPDGTCWESEERDPGRRLIQRDPSGQELAVHPQEAIAGWDLLFDIAPDGTVWSAIAGDNEGFGGLVSYDGNVWTQVELDGPDQTWGFIHDLRVAPDGTVWVVANGSPAGMAVLSWDGGAWTMYEWDWEAIGWWGCCPPYPGTDFLPDGSPWFGGVVEIDGVSLRPIDIRASIGASIGIELAAVRAVANRPDGSTWLVIDPGHDDDRPRTPPPHLYVITPEAMTVAE